MLRLTLLLALALVAGCEGHGPRGAYVGAGAGVSRPVP